MATCITCSEKNENTTYGNNPSAGNYITVNGIKMYYEIYGKGEPMVLIHGNGGDVSSFRNQIPFFSKYYKVIVADSRAQGKSGDNAQQLSYQLMASDWMLLIKELKLDSVYICGWSDGGIIGLIMAMDSSCKVKKLAVMGANIMPDTTAYPKYVLQFNKRAIEYVDSMISCKNTQLDWTRKRKQLKIWTEINIPFSELHKIKIPTLVMAGDKDMIREEHTLKIYQNIEKSHLCIFPEATHYIPVDDPLTFNQRVYKFISTPYTRPDQKQVYEFYIKRINKFFGT